MLKSEDKKIFYALLRMVMLHRAKRKIRENDRIQLSILQSK